MTLHNAFPSLKKLKKKGKKTKEKKKNWFVIDFVPSVSRGLYEMTSWFLSNLNQSKSYDNGIFIK